MEKFLEKTGEGVYLLWTGLAGSVAAVWTTLPERVEQVRQSFMDSISKPWHLFVFYSALFAYICHQNWGETKEISGTIFAVVAEVTNAVWKELSDPKRLVYYALFMFMVRTFPEILASMNATMLKSVKLQ